MIDRRIAKIKLRRGSESERIQVTFEEGELVYTTDSKKVYIGDGVTVGGNIISSKVTVSENFPATADKTDIYYNTVQDRGFIFDGDQWQQIGGAADGTTLEFESGTFRVKDGGIQRQHIGNEAAAINGGLSSLSAEGLFINYDPTAFEVDQDGVFKLLPNNDVLVNPAGAISKSTIGLSANVDNVSILIVDNAITLDKVYNNQLNGNITPDKVDSTFANENFGITVDTNGIAIKSNTNQLNFDGLGNLQINPAQYGSLKNNNGYQILPNSFVMQWGQLPGLSANKFTTIPFPLSSWSVCYNVQVTIGYNNFYANNFVSVVKNITLTSFDVGLDYGGNYPSTSETAIIYWTAIGYNS
jgi:hypothetical protein